MMRPLLWSTLLALTVMVAACGPKVVPLPPTGPDRFPTFVKPAIVAADGAAGAAVDRAWRFLQAGEFKGADRELAAALKLQPGSLPAQTTAAYLLLARNDATGAVAQFGRLADAHPTDLAALVGRGLALEADGHAAEAAQALRAALAVDGSLTDIARRVDVLTLRGLQEQLAAASAAAKAGDVDGAMRAYRMAIAASPDSAFLYRELGRLELQQGAVPAAVDHATRAHDLDATDVGALVLLGDAQAQQDNLAAALDAYARALEIEFDPAVDARRVALRARLDRAAMPEQYRAIDNAPQVTRADLAALIGVRLAPVLQAAPAVDVGLLTDVRGQWAERWIGPVARAGIIEALPNHTFQPRGVVRRVDLAQAMAKLLTLVAASKPAVGQGWSSARGRFSDLGTGHIAYAAASMSVAAGVMRPTEEGAFQPTRVVSGADAIAAVERVRALAGLTGTDGR